MAVLYISGGKPLCFMAVLYSSFFQMLISEVTERIPFILSHNIRSRCNLIVHPQKFVDLYRPQKNHPKIPKMGISDTKSDIRRRVTLQRNFTSTIAALMHYEGPSSVNLQKRANFDPKSEYMTPHPKIWDPLNISGTMRNRKLKFYTRLDRAKYSFQV